MDEKQETTIGPRTKSYPVGQIAIENRDRHIGRRENRINIASSFYSFFDSGCDTHIRVRAGTDARTHARTRTRYHSAPTQTQTLRRVCARTHTRTHTHTHTHTDMRARARARARALRCHLLEKMAIYLSIRFGASAFVTKVRYTLPCILFYQKKKKKKREGE